MARVRFSVRLGIHLFVTTLRMVLRASEPPIQRVPRARRSDGEADHSLPPCAEIKNAGGEMKVKLRLFLTLVTDRGRWLASHFGWFTPGERTLGTLWVRWLEGPQSRSERFLPLPDIELPCRRDRIMSI
jgi:hypothetical protein